MAATSSSKQQHRRELLETIESQKSTIAKYETRLRDVVRAYKGLAKEKEALEASLNAILDGQQAAQALATPGGQAEGATGEDVDAKGSLDSDAQSTTSERSQDSNVDVLEAKVKTLTASLATLTAEKSRLEATFQEDRRRLIQDRKQKQEQLQSVQIDLEQLRGKSKMELGEIKSKLIIERHEREKEASDHAVMIRELQKLLSDERREKEKLEHSVQDLEAKVRSGIVEQSNKADVTKASHEVEAKLKLKVDENGKLRTELEKSETQLESLKKDLMYAKMSHRKDIDKFEKRAESAEARVAAVRVEQEQRVNSLEARLQELSETIGTYDRLRQHDQAEIQKLTDRLHAMEEMTLHIKAESSSGKSPKAKDISRFNSYEGESIEDLLENLFHLKSVIKEKNAKSDKPVDLDSLFYGTKEGGTSVEQELEEVRRELEEFKMRAEITKQNSIRHLLPEVDQEVVLSLKTQVSELQDNVGHMKRQMLILETEKQEAMAKEKEMRECLADTKQQWKEKCDAVENDLRSKVLQLESELQKQRERCLILIEEKEDEVGMLKANMEMAFDRVFSSSPDLRESQVKMALAQDLIAGGRKKSRNSSKEDDLTEGLASSGGEGMVLHYVQEISHKDVEIASLRKQVFDLESTMRELQMNALAKEEKYVEQIELLRENEARLKRMMSSADGDGSNLEYLKNVVLNYMLSSDAASRDHMLKAIGTVLIFSPSEMKRVRDFNAAWWWSNTAFKSAKPK